MRRVICSIIAAAIAIMLAQGLLYAADHSMVTVLDLPKEKMKEELGVLPASKLTPADKAVMSSWRFDADSLKVLVIPVEWSNRPATYSRETIDSLFFSRNVFPGGSVADYYNEVSYGQITIVGEVLDWYNAGFYSGDFTAYQFEAIFDDLDPTVDYTQFDGDYDGNVDAAVFLRSGTGEEDSQNPDDIWSYAFVYSLGYGPGPYDGGMHIPRWNTSPELHPLRLDLFCPYPFSGDDTLNRIRVFCHELGHCLGLPDLYDYDSKLATLTYTTPNDDNDHPLVDWCLMGYYGYGVFSLGSEVPSHLCGWSKKRLGWLDPIQLDYGTYSNLVIYNIETTNDSSLYMLPIDPAEGEYFLLEYRNPRSSAQYDKMDSDFSVFLCPDLTIGCDTLDRGLLITHVHDSLTHQFTINNGTPEWPHYSVAVEDAGYNPSMDAGANPEGHVTDSAQWWYPYETRKGATFNPDVAGQTEFGPSTYPSSDGYYFSTGMYVRVDSIVGDKLYAYVENPLQIGPHVLSISPSRNQNDVDPATNITVTFDMDVNGATFDPESFIAHGSQSGIKSGSFSYNALDWIFTYNRASDFLPGEVATVIMTDAIKSAEGVSMSKPWVSTFTVATAEAPADFSSRTPYSAGDGPSAVTSADFDGDGSADIAVANSLSHDVSILLNNGSGGFEGQVTYDVVAYPAAICAADLDNDGDIDLAVANRGFFPSCLVSVLINDGTGAFGSTVNYEVQESPLTICSADLDGDGDFDLVTGNDPSASVSVLFNNGDATFAPAVSDSTDFYPRVVASADLDNDDDMDLVTTNFESNTVCVLLNDGTGAFPGFQSIPAGTGPSGLALVDLFNNGDLDIVVSDGLADSVLVIYNYGSGIFGFGYSSSIGSGDSPGGLIAADFDGDGDMDVATPNINTDDVSILLNDGYGFLAFSDVYSTGSDPYWLCSADFDGDGDIDIATADHSSDVVSVLLNDIGYVVGDADGSSEIDIDDVVYLIGYIFSGGPAPDPLAAGDADCSGEIDIDDVVYLISYIFSGGPPPGDPDNNGVPDC